MFPIRKSCDISWLIVIRLDRPSVANIRRYITIYAAQGAKLMAMLDRAAQPRIGLIVFGHNKIGWPRFRPCVMRHHNAAVPYAIRFTVVADLLYQERILTVGGVGPCDLLDRIPNP